MDGWMDVAYFQGNKCNIWDFFTAWGLAFAAFFPWALLVSGSRGLDGHFSQNCARPLTVELKKKQKTTSCFVTEGKLILDGGAGWWNGSKVKNKRKEKKMNGRIKVRFILMNWLISLQHWENKIYIHTGILSNGFQGCLSSLEFLKNVSLPSCPWKRMYNHVYCSLTSCFQILSDTMCLGSIPVQKWQNISIPILPHIHTDTVLESLMKPCTHMCDSLGKPFTWQELNSVSFFLFLFVFFFFFFFFCIYLNHKNSYSIFKSGYPQNCKRRKFLWKASAHWSSLSNYYLLIYRWRLLIDWLIDLNWICHFNLIIVMTIKSMSIFIPSLIYSL